MSKTIFPYIGYGTGLRPEHYDHILKTLPKTIDWFEIISENFIDSEGKPRTILEQIMAHYPIVMHGVSLSIGSSDPLNMDYLKKLKKLIKFVKPVFVSDHLCWTGVNKINTHDLLPVPYTEEALKHIIKRIKQVQDYLERPLTLENPSTYLEFKSSDLRESEFIKHMAEESGCNLLLDANNIFVTCFNHRLDAQQYIDDLPLERVAYMHLAGHSHCGTHIIDTHDNFVSEEVWKIYSYILSKREKINTMIEWDDNIPNFATIEGELAKAKKYAKNPALLHNQKIFSAKTQPKVANDKSLKMTKILNNLQAAILLADNKEESVSKWVADKKDFPASKQVGVYSDAYRFRLFDSVFDDFPATRFYLGGKKFDKILNKYIETHQSNHYNIGQYSLDFPVFLKAEKPFIQQMAEFETATLKTFDLKDKNPTKKVETDPDKVDVSPKKSTSLMKFDYDIEHYYSLYQKNKKTALSAIEKQLTYLAIYKSNNDVVWLKISAEEYELLKELSDHHLVDAIENCITSNKIDGDYLMANIKDWFGKWAANKLLEGS